MPACSAYRSASVGPAGLVLVLGPEQVLGLVADGVELLLHIEVQLERIGDERLLDLLLAVEGLRGVASHVERLGRELRLSCQHAGSGTSTLSNRLRTVELKSCS